MKLFCTNRMFLSYLNTINSKSICAIVITILFGCLLTISGCSSIAGYTDPVSVKLPSVHGTMPMLKLGLIDYDESKMLVQNTCPFKTGGAKFSKQDLSNLQISLEKGIAKLTGNREPFYEIHVIVRSNMISFSNAEVALLTAIGWCISDQKNSVIFKDNFYVSKYNEGFRMGAITLGGYKEEIMKKIVTRILHTSAGLVNGTENLNAVPVEDVYTSYALAVSQLPANMSMSTALSPFSNPKLDTSYRHTTNWRELGTRTHLDWEKIILKRAN